MTDLTPNDLSHMSDGDFNALCPQGHHAPGAEPLSSAAQAVLDAYWTDKGFIMAEDINKSIAAALRAAADQSKGNPPDMTDQLSVMYNLGWDDCAKWLREIAAELEALPDD